MSKRAAGTHRTLPSVRCGQRWCRWSVAVLIWFGGACSAQPIGGALGPLFFTPAERQAIAASRNKPQDQAAASTVISLSGVVTRSGGKSTAWINGQPMREGEAPLPGMPLSIGHGQIKVHKHSLRIGETLDLTTLQRTDILSPDSVTRQ